MTPREKLIEKVAVIIRTQNNLPHAGFADCHEYLQDSKMIAEAIIDYLKLEVVNIITENNKAKPYCNVIEIKPTQEININNLEEV